jgi:hypothetical protein
METQDFTTAFMADQSPMEAFDAINNVRDWWTGETEGDSHKFGDEFVYRYKDVHYSKQKITGLVPGKMVEWLVTDSSLNFIDDKSEWIGTRMVFFITERDGKTEVRFTHYGLVPQGECYGACSNAWSGLINHSLRELIATGKPQVYAL